jgi:hypothetical protein
MSLRLRCREATKLLLERENRPLGPVERLALRAHLAICDACTKFDGQVKLMRGAMARWRSYTDR